MVELMSGCLSGCLSKLSDSVTLLYSQLVVGEGGPSGLVVAEAGAAV